MNFDVTVLRDGLTAVTEEDFGLSLFKAQLGHCQAVTLIRMLWSLGLRDKERENTTPTLGGFYSCF